MAITVTALIVALLSLLVVLTFSREADRLTKKGVFFYTLFFERNKGTDIILLGVTILKRCQNKP